MIELPIRLFIGAGVNIMISTAVAAAIFVVNAALIVCLKRKDFSLSSSPAILYLSNKV